MRRSLTIFALFLGLGAHAAAAPAPLILVVEAEGVVHPVTSEILGSALDRARERRAALVILRINTPGGLMDAMRQCVEKILASPVPVAVLVAPSGGRAASAGFFLLEAGDVAAMAPGTSTGAAHPVLLGREMDPVMKQKAENDAAAMLRAVSSRRGRDSATAEKAVRESRSFTEREALENRLIELIASDERDLARLLEGREVVRFDGRRETLHTAGAVFEHYEPTLRQRIVSAIADPNIALVLLVIGALFIYLEFTQPGLIAPGVIGALMVLLGLSAMSVLPINWLGAALLLLAVALFILEAKIASHGVLGAGGAFAMTLGAVMLVDSPLPEMRIRWTVALAVALPFSFITAALLTLALRARRNKIETGAEGMIGMSGTVLEALAPRGKVLVHGEYWDAVSSTPAAKGARVRIDGIDGLTLTVTPEAPRPGGVS